MKTVAVIPARYASSRLPGKPLKDIGGRPMIQHVYDRVAAASLIDDVIVATDDERIAEAVERFGGKAVMTSKNHPNGTSRAAEAVAELDVNLVINVQGDEPLIAPEMIDELVAMMCADASVPCATLCYEISEELYHDPNVVKVVMNLAGDALYFSRSLIPFERNAHDHRAYEHIGIYGFTKAFLLVYDQLEETPLSETESLEQLKVLEHGYRMKVAISRYPYQALSVDNEEDLEKVRAIVARSGS